MGLSALLVASLAAAAAVPDPPGMAALECAVHQLAFEYGSSLLAHLPGGRQPAAAAALHAALNLGAGNCSGPPLRRPAASKSPGRRSPQPAAATPLATPLVTPTFFVATTGSDANPGTEAAPFATLSRAAAATANNGGGASVVVRAGKYFMSETLLLGPGDSNTAWSACPGERVVLSGGVPLSPAWERWEGKILRAALTPTLTPVAAPALLSPAEQLHWFRRRGRGAPGAAAAPLPDPPAAPNPPAPPGYQRFPGHCMSERVCTAAACGCASRSFILKYAQCAPAACFGDAQAACTSDRRCTSFAIPNGGHPGIASFETYAGLKNDSAVPDKDWTAYAQRCAGTPAECTPPPLPPPPPRPGRPHEWGAPPARANSLFVAGIRQVKARFPNGNPQDSTGVCFSTNNHPGEGCPGYLRARGAAAGTLPAGKVLRTLGWNINRGDSPTSGCAQCTTLGSFGYTISAYPEGHPVYNAPLPGIGWGNRSLFTCKGQPDLFTRPAGVWYGGGLNKTYADASTATVHMFHGDLWGGWQYQVASQLPNASQLLFGYGGYQEARGSSITSNHYYIEGLLEELDAPGEWFLDPKVDPPMLYLWPNRSVPAAGSPNAAEGPSVVLPLLESILVINGSKNVSFSGFEFTETRATFMNMYESPSGGDWAVHRGATVLVTNAEQVSVRDCVFNQTGGNALMLSGGVTNSTVEANEFVHTGDSAVLLLGRTQGIDGTAPTYPNHNRIAYNLMHEIGAYGKQTSCVFHSLAANSTVTGNVCFNGPRAGFNWNDGHGGGSTVSGNLIFNMVRETGKARGTQRR